METNPHSPDLETEYCGDLLGFQVLHVMKDQDHAQRSGQPQDGLMKKMALLASNRVTLRTSFGTDQKAAELLVVRNQLVQ